MKAISENIDTYSLIKIWFISIIVNSIVTAIWITWEWNSNDAVNVDNIFVTGVIFLIVAFIFNVLLSAPGLFIFVPIAKFIISKYPKTFRWTVLLINLLCIISSFFVLGLVTGTIGTTYFIFGVVD